MTDEPPRHPPPNPDLLRAPGEPPRTFCCSSGAEAWPARCPWEAEHRTRQTANVAVSGPVAIIAPRRSPEAPDTTRAGLSPRERQIVAGWAAGWRTHEIAARLQISSGMANKYGSEARLALGARTQAHAVALALRDRAITPADVAAANRDT